jgi:uncharacterized protein (DUF305 family)
MKAERRFGLGIWGSRTHVDLLQGLETEADPMHQVKRASRLAILMSILLAGACATGGTGAGDGTGAMPEPAADHADHADHADQATHQAGGVPGVHPADVRFMQQMIGHHAQALMMAAMAPTHGAGEKLLRLAEKIDISQSDEIGMMEKWLRDRRQEVPSRADAHAMHTSGVSMPGMLTAEELERLNAARGPEFERLFLTFMIRHHEGALQMVDELFASPGAAQDSDIFRFVTDVAADQLDEIDQMQYLLDTMRSNQESEIR